MRNVLMVLLAASALTAPAITKHYSFRGGYPAGMSTGRAPSGGFSSDGFAISGDKAKAGAVAAPAAKKTKDRTLKGKVVKVETGDLVVVSPTGGARQKVKLLRVAAPAKGEAYFQESVDFLSGLVSNKTVEVRWQQKDKSGAVLGTVFMPHPEKKGAMVEVNLTTVTNGSAKYVPADNDDPKAFSDAETFARNAKRGLWAVEAQ